MNLNEIQRHADRVFTNVVTLEQLLYAERYCTFLLKFVEPEDEDTVMDMLSTTYDKTIDTMNLPVELPQMENYSETPDYISICKFDNDDLCQCGQHNGNDD